MDGLEGQLQGVTKETTELLMKTNNLAADLQTKSEKLNSVVDAVKGVGESVNGLNSSVRRITSSVVVEAEKNEDKIAQIVQWSNVAMGIFDKWKERRGQGFTSTGYQPMPGQKKLPEPDNQPYH